MSAQMLWTVRLYELKSGFKVVLQGAGRKVSGVGASIEGAYRAAEVQLIYKPPFVPAK